MTLEKGNFVMQNVIFSEINKFDLHYLCSVFIIKLLYLNREDELSAVRDKRFETEITLAHTSDMNILYELQTSFCVFVFKQTSAWRSVCTLIA